VRHADTDRMLTRRLAVDHAGCSACLCT